MKSILGQIIIAALLCSGDAVAKTFVTRDSFAIRLPDDWSEAPPEALRSLEAVISEMSGGTNEQKYDYGYQLESAQTWFEYPYILIQVVRGGRIPEGELTEIERIRSDLREGVDKAQASLNQIVSNSSQGQTLYDETEHVLWSTISADYGEVGQIRGLIAIKLTEYGFVQIMGYATDATFAEYSPIFRDAVRNLIFADPHRYQTSITDYAPRMWGINLGQVAIAGGIGGLLGGGVVLARRLLKKRKPDDT